MHLIVQATILGLLTGGVYALMATGLTLALTVPPGVIPDAASTCATAAGCPVADLDPGATTTVTVALATPGALTGTVTANLSTTGTDSDTRNDTASAALAVHAPAVVLSPAVGPPGMEPHLWDQPVSCVG